jgi:hypothetical protein
MPTFPLGYMANREHVRNARLLERLARETGGDIEQEREKARQRRYGGAPADERSLRGIPAVGRSTGSVMPGTQPEAALMARERERTWPAPLEAPDAQKEPARAKCSSSASGTRVVP